MLIDRFIRKQISKFTRKKENCFDHIVSLGYNCEVTFRFFKYFHFEETGLFNWTYAHHIDDLINALTNLDAIGTGDFEYPSPLFECKNTHIYFHGKQRMDIYMNKTPTDEIFLKDKEDLTERIQHFKEKFLKIAQNNDSKLYIYKIQDIDINEEIEEKIKALYFCLEKLGAVNFKLLVINAVGKNFDFECKNIISRTVKYYAPDSTVTSRKFYDNGWDNIYAEFWQKKPKNYEKSKKYKFER